MNHIRKFLDSPANRTGCSFLPGVTGCPMKVEAEKWDDRCCGPCGCDIRADEICKGDSDCPCRDNLLARYQTALKALLLETGVKMVLT